MGSIADKLTYLQETKTAIKNAIVSKGVEVSDTDSFRSYADKISSISSGSAGTPLVIDSLPAFIVGSPNNYYGIVSGFEDKNYVDDKQYDTLVGKSYYIKFRFTGNSIPNQSCIIHGEKLLNLEVSRSGEMTAYNFKTGSIITLLDSIEFNTWYYAIITMEEIAGHNSTNKKYYISTISYNHAKANGLKGTLVDNCYYGNGRSTFFGRSSYAAGSAATTLTIDFNNTCIKYNDSDTIYKVYKLDTTVIGGVKESTFTGYIAQSGSTNVLPAVLQPVYGNEFKGLMKINNSNSDGRKFILDSTFNSGTDGTLEAFIHYIHDPNVNSNSGIFSIGGVHWKAVYVGTDASLSLPFIDIGNNGSSWAFDHKFQNVNLTEHPEFYSKLTINASSTNLIIYDTDKTTILDEMTFEIDTTPIDSTIILFNNWDLSSGGGMYANAGTIDLSDSYIKINDVVVQGILK